MAAAFAPSIRGVTLLADLPDPALREESLPGLRLPLPDVTNGFRHFASRGPALGGPHTSGNIAQFQRLDHHRRRGCFASAAGAVASLRKAWGSTMRPHPDERPPP